MIIKVNGKHLDVGDALRESVEAALPSSVMKYAENPIDGSVTFSKDHHEIKCDCTVHLSTGMIAQAKGRGGDAKRRLKDHNRKSPIEKIDAAAFIIEPTSDDGEEPVDLQPVIVAESSTAIPTLSVGDAVMHMEMGGENVLMFHNEKNSTLNVVYRREDGNIGWIDPTPVSRAS